MVVCSSLRNGKPENIIPMFTVKWAQLWHLRACTVLTCIRISWLCWCSCWWVWLYGFKIYFLCFGAAPGALEQFQVSLPHKCDRLNIYRNSAGWRNMVSWETGNSICVLKTNSSSFNVRASFFLQWHLYNPFWHLYDPLYFKFGPYCPHFRTASSQVVVQLGISWGHFAFIVDDPVPKC